MIEETVLLSLKSQLVYWLAIRNGITSSNLIHIQYDNVFELYESKFDVLFINAQLTRVDRLWDKLS